MKQVKNIARYGLILALAGFLSGPTLVPELASAQTVTASWRLTGDANTTRYGHTATLLSNGKVLVAGGGGRDGNCFATNSRGELYDPGTGSWNYTGNLNTARVSHRATLLQNGQVLVAGGWVDGYGGASLNSAELYDPATGQWRPTGSLGTIRVLHSATLLPNGKVLAVGDSNLYPFFFAELYDPAAGTWNITGSPSDAATLDRSVFARAILLPNGKVLTVGAGPSVLYDPLTGRWSPAGTLDGISAGTMTLLRNGKVLVTSYSSLVSRLYDPNAGIWKLTGSLIASHQGGTATLLPDGRVLLAGDYNSNHIILGEELYDPATETWSYTSRLIAARGFHTATLLQNGNVLVAGGVEGGLDGCEGYGSLRSRAELYDPAITSTTNPIDEPQFFVRQHYLDFLNREPDQVGWDYWTNEISKCGTAAGCIHSRRIGVSAAFFVEAEFQETGYVVYRLYRGAHGASITCGTEEVQCQTCNGGKGSPCEPRFLANVAHLQFVTDRAQLVAGPGLPQSTINLANNFVQRPEFKQVYPEAMTPSDFVNKLFDTANLTGSANASQRQTAIDALTNGSKTRAQVLLDLIEISEFKTREYNPAFVLMQYFGYLRRDPDHGGYYFWLDVVNNRVVGNYRAMVCAFLTSREYQLRFGSVVTRTDADCGQ